MAFSIGFFCSHSAHNVTLRRIQNLDGFSIGFCCSHSAHNVTLRRIQNLNGFFYRIFLFTLRAQRDAPTYTKLEWLFYRIFLFTLRAQHDAPTYTKTTDQCGARSGSPQLSDNSWVHVLWPTVHQPAFPEAVSGACQTSMNVRFVSSCPCWLLNKGHRAVRSHTTLQ